MKETEKITHPSYLLKLTWPVFVELILQMLVGNIDQFMVGQYSQLAVGAIGNANQILNVLIITFSVISTAAMILISQYLGANDQRKVQQLYTLSFVVNMALSLIIGAILLVCNRQIFEWMRVPEELMEGSQQYISVIGGCLFLQAMQLTLSAFFRSHAMMKESMVVSVAINIVNVGGNMLLINGMFGLPALGVVGAAISSNLSRVAGLAILFWLFYKKLGARFTIRHLRPFPSDMLRQLLRIGLPSGGESLSYNMTQVFIMSFVNLFGAVSINTKVYAGMFAMCSYLFSSAIGQASQVIVGYLVGANDLKSTNRQVWYTCKMSMLVSLVVAVLLCLFSGPIFHIFTSDPEVIRLGAAIMLIEIFLEWGRSVNIVMVRCLQAAGDIRFPVTLGILSAWTVAVLGGYLIGVVAGWGLIGIWIAMACDECIRAVVFLLRWKSGAWKNKSFVQHADGPAVEAAQ
ncbi:MAG: MATE family efflux transporter [Oscillospiraceae bacterium]|nr:MATE family efflux transporter [Oscillospiraceae bacterium]